MNMTLLAASLAGLSVFFLFVGLSRILSATPDAIKARLDRFASREGELTARSREDQSEGQQQGPLLRIMNRFISQQEGSKALAAELARADLKLTPSEYVMINFMSVLVCSVIGWFLGGTIIALGAGVVGFYLPRFYVGQRQAGRVKAFDGQLGDTLTLIANSLRSGYSLLQALETVSKELPPPISLEFGRVVREISLGLPSEEALSNLMRRIPSEDLDMMITAINIQSEVGGNLAEILDTISHTIRERVRIKGEIKTLTAQQRGTGYIITFLPVAIAAFMYVFNRDYFSKMYTEPCGWIMIGAIVLSIGAAFFIMRKIVSIEV